MQQGSDIAPQAVSTRMVAGMWWFFTLIMISSYTANLTAFLTITRMESTIKSAEDLAEQTKIKFGPMRGGSTSSFFSNSNHTLYQRMWAMMQQAKPDVFAESNIEGVERVQKAKGRYAFFMESVSIEYEIERRCELTQINGLLDQKGYGIALPINSPYRSLVSGAVLKLSENGVLGELKNKWWKKNGGGKCDLSGEAEGGANNELTMANVGGMFVVLVVGCCAAFLVAILEFLWNCRKIAVERKFYTEWIKDVVSWPDPVSPAVLFHLAASVSGTAWRNTYSNDHQDVAFQYAVERINMDTYLLPHSRLERHIANVSFVDSFTTGKRVCDLMEVGVTAVFGPESDRSKGIVRSICDTLEIPNLQTNWRGSLKLDAPCQLNMHPDPDAIALALVDVLKFLSWKSFAIVYESNEGLMRLQEVFKSRDKLSAKISVYQLSMDGDHRPLFKDIHDSTQTHILLDCATDHIMDILRQAKEVDMFGDYENYFITSLDAHTLDFSEFEHLQTNVTFLRLIDPNSPEVIDAVNDWVHGEREYGRVLNIRPETVRVEAALMYDAVNLFARAITQLDNNNPIEVTPLNCESGNIWPYGFALKNYMKHIKFKGMTGDISFDARGWRNHFTLDVVEVLYGGITKIGVWDSIDGINSTKTYEEKLIEIEKSIQNKTFIVFSKIGMPYLGWKDKNAEGNDRFEGFSMDLISEIMIMMKAKGFEFRLVYDNNHGSLNKKTGKWNGIMKEIIDRKGDLGICDLTITYDRRQAVDFTMPFMNLGISILFTKLVKEEPELFSFLKPFSFDVWIFLATAYLTISLLLFFLARRSSLVMEHKALLMAAWRRVNNGSLSQGSVGLPGTNSTNLS
uniref:Uncharacterized protein n=1 Tax=Timema monikensis TaxID=170555 RepID=A0A7R9HUR0_9NEOP|nr:unnamed protein product [Timema monikensis]